MNDGWIKLHRKIKDNDIWNDKEPFTKRDAWIDLLLRATHKEEKFLIGNTVIKLKAGQIFTSQVQLAKDWKWSRHKVQCFLNLLTKSGQITNEKGALKKAQRYTLLTITNWELYQSDNSGKNIEKSSKRAVKEQSKSTYKNVKNVKEIKHIVKFLNSTLNSSFRSQTLKTQLLINARLNENRTIKDFELVIKDRAKKWRTDKKMKEYLRPETLFGSKMEGYLQEAKDNKKQLDEVIA